MVKVSNIRHILSVSFFVDILPMIPCFSQQNYLLPDVPVNCHLGPRLGPSGILPNFLALYCYSCSLVDELCYLRAETMKGSVSLYVSALYLALLIHPVSHEGYREDAINNVICSK